MDLFCTHFTGVFCLHYFNSFFVCKFACCPLHLFTQIVYIELFFVHLKVYKMFKMTFKLVRMQQVFGHFPDLCLTSDCCVRGGLIFLKTDNNFEKIIKDKIGW